MNRGQHEHPDWSATMQQQTQQTVMLCVFWYFLIRTSIHIFGHLNYNCSSVASDRTVSLHSPHAWALATHAGSALFLSWITFSTYWPLQGGKSSPRLQLCCKCSHSHCYSCSVSCAAATLMFYVLGRWASGAAQRRDINCKTLLS